MRGRMARREFLYRGFLAALGAGLASCPGPQRLAEITQVPLADMAAFPPTIAPTLTDTSAPTTEAAPTPAAEAGSVSQLHEARYYLQLEGNRVQRQMGFRQCTVREGGRGFWRNKASIDGCYHTLVYGRPSALQIDSIEKEPSYHMLPGY